MRILLSWPGHSHSTYDVCAGYEKALKRLGHDVRNFDYHNRLSFYASCLTHFAEADSGFKRRHGDSLVLASESIILEAVDFVPDVVLIINGMNLHRRAYELLKRLSLPVVMLLTESPYLDELQTVIASKGHAAAVLTNDLNSVEALSDELDIPVAYLPHSYDKERHMPRRSMGPGHFEHDVFFHGTLWPERMETFAPLAALIDDYEIYIDGIIPTAELIGGDQNRIDPDDLMDNHEMAIHYAGSKIIINQHRTIISGGFNGERHIGHGEAYSLGPRVYEAAACGTLLLTDGDRQELHDIFNGHIPTYKGGAELLEKVRYYLAHDDERERMAAAAMEAVQGCSFDDRANDILIPFLTEVTNGCTI